MNNSQHKLPLETPEGHVTLAEYCHMHQRTLKCGRVLITKGAWQSAVKISNRWYLNESEPWPEDKRHGALNGTIRIRVCKQCGRSFPGGPRAWYCPECRAVRQRENEKKHKVSNRPLGSIDHCLKCGKEYVVKGGLQKYCPDCAADAVREKDRIASKEWNQAHKEEYYKNKNEKRRSPPDSRACLICGTIFTPPAGKANQRTCSPECQKERKRQRQRVADSKRQRHQ